ncbi:MAG: cysteine desulfurase [Bdellovibrionaceae bacterium]|nr:cysteine desulfurase [Pseudobdellovibrionaceae bacterium]
MTHQPLTVCGSKNIYLDHNATTPVSKSVIENVPNWLEAWGNPSSIHWNGRQPKAILRESRKKISALLKASSPLELIFTSGGSEANNLALWGSVLKIQSFFPERTELITSVVEHPSVLKTMEAIAKYKNMTLHKISVNQNGEIDLDDYFGKLNEKTALVSIMSANNETGSLFPIKKMVRKAHEVGAIFHTDAVQALGKIAVDVKTWGVDMASFSAHKFYALKGCGVLYVKQGTALESQIFGGGQERGRRAGTENILAIAAFAKMSDCQEDIANYTMQMAELRDFMETQILNVIPDIEVVGGQGKRLPNTSSLIIKNVNGESLLINLDMQGVSVSTGAACSAGNPEPSPVLIAMGYSRQQAQSSLRLSIGWTTTKEEILKFVNILKEVVIHLRNLEAEEKSWKNQES